MTYLPKWLFAISKKRKNAHHIPSAPHLSPFGPQRSAANVRKSVAHLNTSTPPRRFLDHTCSNTGGEFSRARFRTAISHLISASFMARRIIISTLYCHSELWLVQQLFSNVILMQKAKESFKGLGLGFGRLYKCTYWTRKKTNIWFYRC